jgi:hypothetical protein
MKKIILLIIILISFKSVYAQEKISKEEQERREKNIQAGNPFVKYGSIAPVATLSKGKYLEVHDLDSIVVIGTSRWDVENKKIVGDIVLDTLNKADAQPTGDIAGRWISPDPLTDEFPDWSPYVAFNNNPVKFIDPTGMATEDCCADLLNFVAGSIAGTVSNVTGSNYFRRGEHSVAFNNGAKTSDAVSLVGATFLTAKGIADTATGGAGMTGSVGATVISGGLSVEVSGPAFVASAALALEGAIETGLGIFVAKNAMNNMKNDSASNESGSYTNTHESGRKYHGKGDESRMNKSAKRVAKEKSDPVKSQDFTKAKNSREGFKQESKRLENDGGAKSNTNYNKRDSPGTKYREQDKK